MLLHDLISVSANNYPQHRAIVRNDEVITYEELSDYVNVVACGFQSIGVRRGDRIGIYLSKRIECVISYFAASASGAIFVPINPALKTTQVGHILRDCNVSVLISTAPQLEQLTNELKACPNLTHTIVTGSGSDIVQTESRDIQQNSWSDIKDFGDRPSSTKILDNDVAAILYTSGSTGKPKGVVLSHRNMVVGALSVSGYLNNSENDRIIAALPFSFDAGFSQLTTAFATGASLVLLDYLVPRDIIKCIASHEITGMTGVPPLWNQLVSVDWPEAVAQNLRYIANTGGAMPTTTLDKLKSRLPTTEIFLMYGLTESFRSTYLQPCEIDTRPTSIGKAIPNAEVLVIRPDGTRCLPGEKGELVHRGPLVSLGYWNDPARTAERFRPSPTQASEVPVTELAVFSGDTVYADEEGFLYFVGRNDDMIKSSGYRISPTDIEDQIYATGLVSECAALGVPHPELGQAIVVIATGAKADDKISREIIRSCKIELPNYMIPKEVQWREEMPKNHNGKIDRKRLALEMSDHYNLD